jgi:excisionase family DNA binding protein
MSPTRTRKTLPQVPESSVTSRLLGVGALQDRTDIKAPTWRKWVREGRLPSLKLGSRVLVAEHDLAVFLATHRRPARAKR